MGRAAKRRGVYCGVIVEIIAVLCSGAFFGAALYVNLVEHPARLSCGVQLAITQWRPSYLRGTRMQVPLALSGSVAAFLAWRFDRDPRWLAGGLLLLLVIPFTLVAILPTNQRLSGVDLSREDAGRLLRQWGRLHLVRTALGGLAFLVLATALAK